MPSKNYKIKEKYKNFEITKSLYLDELKCTLIEAVHTPTNAKVMHIQNDDTENLFSLSFPTHPSSSNGAPHILEHTVLCGSKKYPVKDPFFSMLRRSLNTFMNAMTGADFTCYPASSQVEKDFYNLFEVYLDAVFFPEIKQVSFLQEGHRLEFTEKEDIHSPLVFKGVVYNEMKGANSSPDERMFHSMLKSLTPDQCYSFNSGGEVKDIPSLTYEGLKEFHKKFYNPSNCLFFFYGNLPLEKHLDFIEEKVLKQFQKKEPIADIPSQKRFSHPIAKTDSFPASGEEENKAILSFGWLTTEISDQKTILSLEILDSVLMENDASLLKYALLQSKLCSDVFSVFETDMKEPAYFLICKGCEEKNAEKIKDLIFSSLKKIASDKIDPKKLKAALHQIEFSRSEIRGDKTPFGLTLFMRSALIKQHGCEAEKALQIHSLFQELEKEIDDPTYWSSLLEKYFIQNTHRVDLLMKPDPQLEEKEHKEEKDRLADISSQLSEKEKKQIVEKTKQLEDYQKKQTTQSLECLPKLSLNDVPKKAKDFPLKENDRKDIQIVHHDCFTNDILYLDLFFDLPKMKEENLFSLSLFTSLLSEVGCGNRDYKENLEFIESYLGGISANLGFHLPMLSPDNYLPFLNIKGKCLSRNKDKLFSLLKDIALSLDFSDKNRINELLTQQYIYLQQSLPSYAVKYAIDMALMPFSETNYLNHELNGLPYFLSLRKAMKDKNFYSSQLETLNEIKKDIFTQKKALSVSCDKDIFSQIEKNHLLSLDEMAFSSANNWKYLEKKKSAHKRKAFVIPAPISFTAMGLKADIHYSDDLAPALLIATHLCEHLVLHKEIREERGAYGGKASFSALSGNFLFYSYRDPYIAATIDSFFKAIDKVANKKFTDQDLEEAKLSALQDLDQPVSPGRRAAASYFWKMSQLTKDTRDAFRQKLMQTTSDDIKEAILKYIQPKLKEASIVTFAGEKLIERENKLLKENHFEVNHI